jgi:hypothetical protein
VVWFLGPGQRCERGVEFEHGDAARNRSHLTPTISPTLDQTNTDPIADAAIVRPDLVGNPILVNRTLSDYFNINAFAPTPAGAARIGNAGVAKVMRLRESLRLRFEATFTNALNHVNFAPPGTNVSSPSTFGVLDAAQIAEYGGNRTARLALRLDF